MKIDWQDLPKLFPLYEDPGRWLQLLQRHAALITDATPRVRVTSVPADEVVRRHYAESLELLRVLEVAGPITAAVDVGSGGGYPGLVIAAVRDDAEIHLIEPLQKRARLLTELADALGLKNVTVHAVRAEDAGRSGLRDASPVVTARAVAELRVLLEYTAPLAADGGVIALPKGSGLDEELVACAHAMNELGLEFESETPMRSEISETLRVALFRKSATTDARYPRRPGIPAKHPL